MYRLMEGEPSSNFRLADPNRDLHQDSHPHIGKIEVPEEDVQGHVKKIGIREVPILGKVLRAANGVNSSSAIVFKSVFDIVRFS